MHISDGVLSPQVMAGAYVVATGIAAATIKKTNPEELPKIAVMTSVFFVASLIHIPVPPTSIHLVLTGLAGVILGWAAFPSIFLGLLLQCLLFQHGGITSLGANACLMGIPSLMAYGIFNLRKNFSFKQSDVVFGAIAGSVAILFNGLFLGGFLLSTGESFSGIANYVILAHIPVMVIEGAVTAFTVTLLKKVKPELLDGHVISHR